MSVLGGATRIFLEQSLELETDDCIIWPFSLDKGGYAQARDAVGQYRPHRRVCEKAHGPAPTPRHHAAHLCGNRPCINKRHLMWATPSENEIHKSQLHGLKRRSTQRTLTDDQVRDIRRRAAEGEQMIVLAAEYSMSNVAISKIVRWRAYRDVA